jgi:hypothetical protein
MRIIRYIFPAVAVAAAAVLLGCAQAGAGSSIDDGTASGTELVLDHKDGGAGSSPSHLTVYDGSLYFSADGGDTGFELWSLTAE